MSGGLNKFRKIMHNIYVGSMGTIGKVVPKPLEPIWNHPAGPQTVFFWLPAFKWGLVIAAIGDLYRPADRINIVQCSSIALTGFVWSRYAMVIIPKNYALLSVNIFVGISNSYLVGKALVHNMNKDKR